MKLGSFMRSRVSGFIDSFIRKSGPKRPPPIAGAAHAGACLRATTRWGVLEASCEEEEEQRTGSGERHLGILQTTLQGGVAAVDVQPLLVRINCFLEAAQPVVGAAEAAVPFRPVWLQLDTLLCILKRSVPLLQAGLHAPLSPLVRAALYDMDSTQTEELQGKLSRYADVGFGRGTGLAML